MAPYDNIRQRSVAVDRSGRVGRTRIGDILLRDGHVDPDNLARSLALQSRSRARIGDILVATGAADRANVAAAAAEQQGRIFVDLAASPPDITLLQGAAVDECLRLRRIPWRTTREGVVYAAADVACDHPTDPVKLGIPKVAIAEQTAIDGHLMNAFGPTFAKRAARRRPDETSHRIGTTTWQRRLFVGLLLIATLTAVVAPAIAAACFLWLAAAVIGLNGIMWLASLVSKTAPIRSDPTLNAVRLADFRRLPVVSILVPLYREPETAPLILNSLAALDYPPELLDIKLILEADDQETLSAFHALEVPAFIDILIAPKGSPKTKPRALNFALEFVRGDIVGIYDAEDRPAPDQVRRIVEQFADAPAEVACIQARLGYYNTSENWLTRCFEIEYASWFDVMLPGLSRLGMPLPLGGTSLFIRRAALDVVGGWDSYNVTEDADLGMTLARAGLRTMLSRSLTEEEANCRTASWIRQRSRWLKGYLATWVTHMRNPLRLFADLGTIGFLGFNAVLLSAVAGYLLLPILWAVSVAGMLLEPPTNDAVLNGLTIVRWVSYITLGVLFAVAVAALRSRGRIAMWPYVLTLPAYWVLGAVAVYLAVWELMFAPARWHKTQHGVGKIAQKIREDALAANQA